jgi:tetratricopeptide (TPR) repeat protein
LAIAREGLPNDVRVVEVIGYIHRRMGNWDEIIAAFEKATELDPRNANLYCDLGGNSLRIMRRYADAVRAFERALELSPDLHYAAVRRGWTFILWQGQLDSLRQALERQLGDQFLNDRAQLLYWQRDADALIEFSTVAPVTVFEYREFFLPTSLYAAWAHRLQGDERVARKAFSEALSILDSVMVVLPDDWRVHAARGLALAGLGFTDEAMREVRWIEQSVVYRKDVHDRLTFLAPTCAQILAQAGNTDFALDEIERLLAGPSLLTVHTLQLDPLWDPIREHPRFNSLLTKYSEI